MHWKAAPVAGMRVRISGTRWRNCDARLAPGETRGSMLAGFPIHDPGLIAMSTVTETRAPPKLSRVPRGHWRTLWRSKLQVTFRGGDKAGPGPWTGERKWPSREIADEQAAKWIRQEKPSVDYYGIVYLGAEFFPEGSE